MRSPHFPKSFKRAYGALRSSKAPKVMAATVAVYQEEPYQQLSVDAMYYSDVEYFHSAAPAPISLLPELWLEIIRYLPQHAIAQVSLTCRTIRELVQPFAFQQLHFDPSHEPPQHLTEHILLANDRLAFLTSPSIACRVRECVIHPKGNVCEATLNATISSIRLWPNLLKLTLQSFVLTYSRIEMLQDLQIKSLFISGCGDVKHVDLLSFRIAVEALQFDPDVWTTGLSSRSQLPAPFLSAASLRDLTAGPCSAKLALTWIAKSPSRFLILTKLTLPVSVLSHYNLLSALSQCPAVESLCLRYSSGRRKELSITTLPNRYLPRLSRYEGPFDLAPLFSEGRPLRDFTLWPVDDSTIFCPPRDLREALNKLNPETEHLDIGSVTQVGSTLIQTIVHSFPKLRSLAMNAHPAFSPPFTNLRDFTIVISDNLHLPSTLENLSLGIQLGPEVEVKEAIAELITGFTWYCHYSRTAKIVFGHHPLSMCLSWERPWTAPLGTPIATTAEDVWFTELNDENEYYRYLEQDTYLN